VKTRFNDANSGIKKHITGNMTLGGVSYTPVTLGAVFSDAIAAMDAADAKHKEWLDDVDAMKKAVAQANALYKLLRSALIGQYGDNDKSTLQDFGMNPPKTGKKTKVTTKAAAAVKAQATRVVRNTKGPKARKQVKSNVNVEITAVPAGSTTSQTTAPSPSTQPPAPQGVAAPPATTSAPPAKAGG
jgi:hypothetical protein